MYNAHPSKTYKFSKFESLVYAVFTFRENSNFLEAIISLLDANDIAGPSTASVWMTMLRECSWPLHDNKNGHLMGL